MISNAIATTTTYSLNSCTSVRRNYRCIRIESEMGRAESSLQNKM